MATPAQPGQQAQQPQPPPPAEASDAALAAAVAGLLMTAASAALLVAGLRLRFALPGALLAGIGGAAGIAMASPPPVTGVVGQASAQASRQNLSRRAQFVVSAGRRLASDMVTARSTGRPLADALAQGLARERRYYSAHLDAMWNRSRAAGMTDIESLSWGPVLGWYATLDGRTSPECRAADGRNFAVAAMPDIGFPGAVHPHCRCLAGPPHPGAKLLPRRGRLDYARAA